MRFRPWCLACLSLLVAACASAPLPVGTLVLAQVAHVATKEDMARGVKVDDKSLLVPPYLLQRCALDAASLESGDLAVMRVWMSSVPKSSVWWVVVPRGMAVTPGDFVEVELKQGLEGERCPRVARVRSPSTNSGECRFVPSRQGNMSIYCNGLEKDGWAKHSAPDGPYEALIWRKAPAR